MTRCRADWLVLRERCGGWDHLLLVVVHGGGGSGARVRMIHRADDVRQLLRSRGVGGADDDSLEFLQRTYQRRPVSRGVAACTCLQLVPCLPIGVRYRVPVHVRGNFYVFAAQQDEGSQTRWAAAGRVVMAAVVLGNAVGLVANAAAAVHYQKAVYAEITSSAACTANNTEGDLRFWLSASKGVGFRFGCKYYFMHGVIATVEFWILWKILLTQKIRKSKLVFNFYTNQ